MAKAKTKKKGKKAKARKQVDVCDSKWCKIRNSPIHGRGLVATREIPCGTRVIEYVGEKVTKKESDRRGEAQHERALKTGEGGVYLFVLNKRYNIDGNVSWNAARLINHSCEPNCETDIIKGRIWVIATRDIEKGEELFYNYSFDLEFFEDHPCACGTDACVGYIVGEEHWKALKKALKKRRKKTEKKRPKKGEKKARKKDKKRKGKGKGKKN